MVQKFSDYLTHEKRFSPHTVRAYVKDVELFAQCVEQTCSLHELQDVEAEHLRSWLASMYDDGLSATSLHRKLSSIKAYYKWLMKYHGLKANPAHGLQAPKAPKRLPVYVGEAEMDGLLPSAVFSDDYNGLRNRAMLELLYHTGMRSSELVGLKKIGVDFQEGSISVLGKRNKERVIPVGARILTLLEAYLRVRNDLERVDDEAYFFLTEKGKKMYPKLVYRVTNYYIGIVSTIQKKSPHVLRHTFATHMLNKGADLNAIKELLGHASLAATQIYTHNSIEQLKEVHRKAHPKG